MTAHLAHAGLLETVGLSLALFVLAFAVISAAWMGGGVSARWLARAAAMRRPHHRRAHRARRPRPRLTSVLTAAHLTLTRNTPGGTR